jgi:hypothetical protein
MALKKLAAGAAMLALATPGLAFDAGDSGASTMFYISIPLDFAVARKQWSAGLQIQSRRDYQAIRIDSTMLMNAFSLNDIDAKYMIAGVVAVGAAAAISAKDKKTTNELQQQQTQQQQQGSGANNTGPGACPRPVTDPCK